MNLIPYEKILLTTIQDPHFVKERLIGKTEIWQNEFLRAISTFKNKQYSDSKKFELKIINNKFILRRINGNFSYNGLRPIVKGKIKNRNEKTIISLTIRQHFLTIFFYGLWCVLSLLISLISFSSHKPFSIVGFLLFIIGYSFCLFGYNTEIKYYKKFLIDTLDIDKNFSDK